jgi:hypothetical protein
VHDFFYLLPALGPGYFNGPISGPTRLQQRADIEIRDLGARDDDQARTFLATAEGPHVEPAFGVGD